MFTLQLEAAFVFVEIGRCVFYLRLVYYLLVKVLCFFVIFLFVFRWRHRSLFLWSYQLQVLFSDIGRWSFIWLHSSMVSLMDHCQLWRSLLLSCIPCQISLLIASYLMKVLLSRPWLILFMGTIPLSPYR